MTFRFAGVAMLGLLALPVGCVSGSGSDEELQTDDGNSGDTADSASSEEELRRKRRDSGTAVDTGTADTAVADSGTAVDSSSPTDTGTVVTDTGTVVTDTGTVVTDTGTVVTDTGTPTGGPSIGGCQLFPSDSPWNTRIDALPLHPLAAQYRTNMAPTTRLHADWGNWSVDGYGIPWQTVPATQSLVPISFDYSSESDPGPYPIPSSPLIEGHGVGDSHMLLLQTGSCVLWEVYATRKEGTAWKGGSGAKFNLLSNKLRPDGWTSADAAGLPILPGLVRYDEVMTGEIKHAIRFTVSRSQNAFIHPATHGASSITDPSYPPMGLRLRLRASFDTSKFTGPALTILTAMKRYGVILADNGSNWYITGDSTDKWTSTLMSQVSSAFSSVTGGDFEAVDTGPVIRQP